MTPIEYQEMEYERNVIEDTYRSNKDLLINQFVPLHYDMTSIDAYNNGDMIPIAITNIGGILVNLPMMNYAIKFSINMYSWCNNKEFIDAFCRYVILHEMQHTNQCLSPFEDNDIIAIESDAIMFAIDILKNRYHVEEKYIDIIQTNSYRQGFLQMPYETFNSTIDRLEEYYKKTLRLILCIASNDLLSTIAYDILDHYDNILIYNCIDATQLYHNKSTIKEQGQYIYPNIAYTNILYLMMYNRSGVYNMTYDIKEPSYNKIEIYIKGTHLFANGFEQIQNKNIYEIYGLDVDSINEAYKDLNIKG